MADSQDRPIFSIVGSKKKEIKMQDHNSDWTRVHGQGPYEWLEAEIEMLLSK